MHIFYIASVRIPNEKASGLAIMRQCEAFVDLRYSVTLLRPHRKNHLPDDPFVFYGINTKFEICTISSIDLVDRMGKFGLYLTRLSQMFGSFLFLLKNKKAIGIIYARDPWMLLLPVFFLKNSNIIWEVHQKYNSFFIKFVAQKVKKIISISVGLKDHYQNIVDRDDIVVEPSGVNVNQFNNLPPVSSIRKEFSIPLDKKIIGYIGKYTTMGEDKGVNQLIEAFGVVYQNNNGVHLIIVGLEDYEIKVVSNICDQNGLPNDAYTLLCLEQKNFAKYVHMADILVMNYPDTEHYRYFMSPTKLFAYMASKKIIVASDLPSVREIVDEQTILFVTPGSQSALVTRLVQAITMCEEDSRVMCNNAFMKVQGFTWNSRCKRILEAAMSHVTS